MKLTRLRLLGFKSFVEPTDFVIEPGLTGVVGPNGCGKSNLVEALRWVMGETSFKSMRASGMDDVIFSGSNTRPARNTAEVSIGIDNAERAAPAAFNDEETLEITRRIERESGSAYRINGREVRARDVQLLFADASTGSRSPALVHQGRIGEIIQAKPDQRRRVLEEAAGISGLHQRRHEAELRLKAAELNLTRLEDVIGQLASQMDGLKRQARQAVRYRTVAAQIRKAEATLFHLRWVAAQTEVADAEHAKDVSVRVVAERTGQQAEASKLQVLAQASLPGLRDAEARAAAALHRLVVARETLEREEQRAKDRMAELDLRLVQLSEDVERERQRASDAEAALDRLGAEETALKAEAQEAATRRSGVDQRLSAADEVLSQTERRFSELTGQLADLSAKRNQLQSASRDQSERAARLAREIADVEAEYAALTSGDRPDLNALATAVREAQNAVTGAESEASAAEVANASARQAVEAARGPLAEAERRVQRLETEAKTLSKVLAVETKNLWPPVMDSVTVQKGFETALGAALGDDLDAPIDPSAPMRWIGAVADPSDPALPEGVEPLSRRVKAPGELARRLSQIGIVSRSDGPALVAALKPGQRLVSPEGDLWRWDGFAAAAHAPTGAARRLAERSRYADIEKEIKAARADAESRRQAADAAQAAAALAATAETEARGRIRERQREADAARDRHNAAEREASRDASRRSALDEARTRLAGTHNESVAAQQEADGALAGLQPADALEQQLAGVRTEIEEQRGKVAEVRAEAQAIAREAELSDRRLQAISSERQAWAQRSASASAQIVTLEKRSEETKTERGSLENAPQAFAEQRNALISQIAGAETERRSAADQLQEAENALAVADKAARAALEAMGAAREEAARSE